MIIVLILVIFPNNVCVNILVTWNQLYNFLLGRGDIDIIDLDYKKGIGRFCFCLIIITKIISNDYSKLE